MINDGIIFINSDYKLPRSNKQDNNTYSEYNNLYDIHSHFRCVTKAKFLLEIILRNNLPHTDVLNIYSMGVLSAHTFKDFEGGIANKHIKYIFSCNHPAAVHRRKVVSCFAKKFIALKFLSLFHNSMHI